MSVCTLFSIGVHAPVVDAHFLVHLAVIVFAGIIHYIILDGVFFEAT